MRTVRGVPSGFVSSVTSSLCEREKELVIVHDAFHASETPPLPSVLMFEI